MRTPEAITYHHGACTAQKTWVKPFEVYCFQCASIRPVKYIEVIKDSNKYVFL